MFCHFIIKKLATPEVLDIPTWGPVSSCLKIIKKTAHRFLKLLFHNQLHKKVSCASPHQDICVIYTDKGNIGDAIGDLSCLKILRESMDFDCELNLVVHDALYELYKCDPTFNNVATIDEFADGKCLFGADLILLFLLDYKAIKTKALLFPKTKFLVLHGWFAGDRNPMLHGAYNIARCFNLDMRPLDALKSVKQVFNPCETKISPDLEIILSDFLGVYVGIVVGGIDPVRTYQRFDKVVERLLTRGIKVLLLGSSNGLDIANKIRHQNLDNDNLICFVGSQSLYEFKRTVDHVSLMICADGGGMHMALGLDTPMISLFSYELPESRMPFSFKGASLHAGAEVSKIEPDLIVKTVFEVLKKIKLLKLISC